MNSVKSCSARASEGSSKGSMRSSGWLLVPVSLSGCPPYTSGLSTWWSSRSLRPRRDWRPDLAEGFTLRCLQRLSWPYVGYPALPRAGQLAHQRYVPPNPLVLGRERRKSPAPTTDRDRPVSRRSKPSSRTAFIGEQPNPWELLHPQDAMSRHRTFFHSFLWRRLCLHPVVDFRFSNRTMI